MFRKPFLQSLAAFEKLWVDTGLYLQDPSFPDQLKTLEKIKNFTLAHQECFERSLNLGHLTGSAFIVSEDFKTLLLMHHAKFKKWQQLGGHADGHPLLHEVALREAQEESGISSFAFFPLLKHDDVPIPFDFDVHGIPDNSKEEAHFHYDVRYLLIAPEGASLSINEESLDLQWVALDEVPKYTQEASILRPLDKLKLLQNQFILRSKKK